MYRLYANSTPFYRIDLSMQRFCYLWRVLAPVPRDTRVDCMCIFQLSPDLSFHQIFFKLFKKDAVLVCSGCHNKIPQIRWLKQQKVIFSCFQRLEVPDPALAALNPVEASPRGFQWVSSMSHKVVEGWVEQMSSGVSFYRH